MRARAWRLYGAGDVRLEDIELESAGEEGIVVELVTNTICQSDYKGVTLGTGHKRVPRDIATRPTMFGYEKYKTVANELHDYILAGCYVPGKDFPSVKMLSRRSRKYWTQ